MTGQEITVPVAWNKSDESTVLRYIVPRSPGVYRYGHDDTIRETVQTISRSSSRNERENVLLRGANGLGKTTVLFEVAKTLASDESIRRQYRALVWVSVSRWEIRKSHLTETLPLVSSLRDLIGTIGASLGHYEIGTYPPEAQMMALYSTLAGEPVVLLVDDIDQIWDGEIERLFRNFPASTAVVATAQRSLDYGRELRIRPLDMHTLDRMLWDTLETWPELGAKLQKDVLQAACGNPLLARLLTSSLRQNRNSYSVDSVIEHTTGDLLEYLAGSIIKSEELQTEGKLILDLAALFPVGITQGYLTSLFQRLDHPSAAIPGALATLEECGLISSVATNGDEVYLLPPLIKRYQQEHNLAVVSLGGLVAEVQLDEALELTSQSHYSVIFELIDRRIDNYIALLRLAAQETRIEIRRPAARLLSTIAYYLHCRGRWDDLVEHTEWATLTLLESEHLREAVMLCAVWATRSVVLRGQNAKAQEIITELRAHLQKRGHSTQDSLFQAIVSYGSTQRYVVEDVGPAEAIYELNRVAKVFIEHEDRELLAMTYNRIGNVLALSGNQSAGFDNFQRSVALAQAEPDRSWANEIRAIASGNQGTIANRNGDHHRAIEILGASVQEIVQLCDQATATMELAIAHFRIGELEPAKKLGNRALQLVAGLPTVVTIGESDPSWESKVLPQL